MIRHYYNPWSNTLILGPLDDPDNACNTTIGTVMCRFCDQRMTVVYKLTSDRLLLNCLKCKSVLYIDTMNKHPVKYSIEEPRTILRQ